MPLAAAAAAIAAQVRKAQEQCEAGESLRACENRRGLSHLRSLAAKWGPAVNNTVPFFPAVFEIGHRARRATQDPVMGAITHRPPCCRWSPRSVAIRRPWLGPASASCRPGDPWRCESIPFEFVETDYYEPTMGPGLHKIFWACRDPMDPARLAAMKQQTNAWELEYAADAGHPESRPLNLDPGYLTPAKLVLASSKDHAHRLYLSDGIYAEVTLVYKDRRWQARDWTFPDYRRNDYHAFFVRCREYLRRFAPRRSRRAARGAAMNWLPALALLPSALAAWLAGYAVRRWAPRWGLVDVPGGRKARCADHAARGRIGHRRGHAGRAAGVCRRSVRACVGPVRPRIGRGRNVAVCP